MERPGDEALRISFKFPRCGWDQTLADFNRFSSVETRSCYSCLVLYLHEHMKNLMKMLLFCKGKTKWNHWKIILFVFCFLTWMMWSYFLALVYMNYLIVISVDNTLEVNYRVTLYPLLQKLFFFLQFLFSILTEKQQMILKKQNFIAMVSFVRGKKS